jgi:DNA-binding LytR/AlgR family response regulator
VKVLVVDDEALARRRLRRLCAELPGVEVVGEAGDGGEAGALLAQLDPDVVLLDIHMPGVDGLALARQLGARPAVVFTTADASLALAAFDVAAVDYLLKPVARERLARALEKVAARPAAPAPPRVSARDGQVLHVVDARQVTRFYALDKYTAFLAAGRELLCEESLGSLEARLADHGFLRVHRGELIRLGAVVALDGELVRLVDGQEARVSRRQLGELRRRLA